MAQDTTAQLRTLDAPVRSSEPATPIAGEGPPDPGSTPVRQVESDQPWIRRLVQQCMEHKPLLVLALSGSVGGMVVNSVSPLIVKEVVDKVILARSQPMLPWIIALLCVGLLAFASGFVRRYYGGKLSIDVQHELRQKVFAALQRLDGAKQDDLQTGQVVSRSISDLNLVQGLLGMLPMQIGNVLTFVMSVILMFTLSPLLTVIALLIGPILWFVAIRGRRLLFPSNWDAQQRVGEVAGVVEAAVTGVRVVKGFGQEEQELDRLDGSARGLFTSRMRTVRLNSFYNPIMQVLPALGQVGVLGLGGYLALQGKISLGTFLAFSTYLAAMVGPVRMLSGLLTIGQQAKAGVLRVFEVIDSRSSVVDAPDAVDLPPGPVDVTFDHATFGYTSDSPVLDDLTFRVAPGETLALVGTAGSGKSTVSLLLPRFYDVKSGAIKIAGRDVRSLTLESLRERIGVVFEDSFLFSDSVKSNIGYGRPDATDDQIIAAAKAAEADSFISELPHGYDTVVGEQGLTLSGGQRQRVALARALITDPHLLLLDDATSAVDSRIEAEIHATLRKVMQGRTTILIAHRRSTLALANRIAVLDSRPAGRHRYPCRAQRALSALPGPAVRSRGRRRRRRPRGGCGGRAARDRAVADEQLDGDHPRAWPRDEATTTEAPRCGRCPAHGLQPGARRRARWRWPAAVVVRVACSPRCRRRPNCWRRWRPFRLHGHAGCRRRLRPRRGHDLPVPAPAADVPGTTAHRTPARRAGCRCLSW